MSRRVFDLITSAGGVAVVVVLVIAGGLLTWGHSFVNSNVHNQLAQQEIYFPPKAAFDHAKPGTGVTPAMIPSVSQYAGQQLLTGAQAKAYSDHFIAVHLSEMPYGGVYSKISAAALAKPTDPKLAALKADIVPGNHPARPAARSLRILDRRTDHALGRDRIIPRRSIHVSPRRPRVLARHAHSRRNRDARAQGSPRRLTHPHPTTTHPMPTPPGVGIDASNAGPTHTWDPSVAVVVYGSSTIRAATRPASTSAIASLTWSSGRVSRITRVLPAA